MGGAANEMDKARDRLEQLLARATKLGIQPDELLGLRPTRRLFARTSGLLGRCVMRLGLLVLVVAGAYLYARWPTMSHEADVVKTVLRKTCGSGDIVDRVATFLHTTSSVQDDC